MGREKCRSGYFVGPADGNGGWRARQLTGGQELVTSIHMSFVDDPRAIHSDLALSDNLLELAGPLRGEVEAVRASVRGLFADNLAPDAPALVILEQLVGAPVELVPALDDDGDPIRVRKESWPLSSTAPGATDEARPATLTTPTPAQLPPPTPSASGRGSNPWAKSLPPATAISFNLTTKKSGKSGERYAKYKEATTIARLKELNPRNFIADLTWDFKRLFLKVSDEPQVLTARRDLDGLDARVLEADMLGHAAQLDTDDRLAASHDSLRAIREFEALERAPTGPDHAGGRAGMIEYLQTFLPEHEYGILGDGLPDYNVIYDPDGGPAPATGSGGGGATRGAGSQDRDRFRPNPEEHPVGEGHP
jgi:hypothetical protein